MTSVKARLAACAVAITVGVGVLLTGAPAAYAADSFTFYYHPRSNGYKVTIRNNTEGLFAGSGVWLQDPEGTYPGDTIGAIDELGDGYGIEVHLLTSPNRIASTLGHPAPYRDYVTGNLPEGRKYDMYVCVVKGASYRKCSDWVTVTA